MFEPVPPSETVVSDQRPRVPAGRPCDLIVNGTRFWCDVDWERTSGTGEYTIDVDIAPIVEFLRAQVPPNPYDGIDSDELTEAAMSLAALEAGVRVQQLVLIAELDARDAWKADLVVPRPVGDRRGDPGPRSGPDPDSERGRHLPDPVPTTR